MPLCYQFFQELANEVRENTFYKEKCCTSSALEPKVSGEAEVNLLLEFEQKAGFWSGKKSSLSFVLYVPAYWSHWGIWWFVRNSFGQSIAQHQHRSAEHFWYSVRFPNTIYENRYRTFQIYTQRKRVRVTCPDSRLSPWEHMWVF